MPLRASRLEPFATSEPVKRPVAAPSRPPITLSAVAGGPLGLLLQLERHPDDMDEAVVDQLAEAILRMLRFPAAEAERLAALSLPEVGAWQ